MDLLLGGRLYKNTRLREAGPDWHIYAAGVSGYYGLSELGREEFCTGDISYVDDLLKPYAAPASRLFEGPQSIATVVRCGFAVT